MKPFASSPADLPPITAIEIVLLNGKLVDPTPQWATTTLTGDAAQRVAELFRQFKPGRSHRCHTPAFGLRFIADQALIGAASICWRCTNLYFYVDGERQLYGFHPETPATRALLAELSRVTKLTEPEES